MQLDKTRIAIRERGVADTMDLALHVLRVYFRPLVVTMALGIIPFALLNDWLLGWMIGSNVEDAAWWENTGMAFRYARNMTWLVVIEAPLASVFATTYLGHAVFMERPRLKTVVRDVVGVLPRVVWCQFLWRGVLAALLLAASMDATDPLKLFAWPEAMLIVLVLAVCVRRAMRPFMNEIILLERNPLRGQDRNAMTVGRRSRLLHAPSGSELTGRWLIGAFYAVLLAFALFGAIVTATGVFWDNWVPGAASVRFGWPTALWLVAGFFTVVRFLNYLDLRIRHEGWEVELRMRAEAARLAESLR